MGVDHPGHEGAEQEETVCVGAGVPGQQSTAEHQSFGQGEFCRRDREGL